jgi:GTP-binding protein YchF
MGVVRVADERVDFLSKILKPKKTTYARVEYLLPSEIATGAAAKSENVIWNQENVIWNQVRACDALIHVVRNFQGVEGLPPAPQEDFWRLEEEMILYDLMVTEKRIERVELDSKRGKKPDKEEYSLLESCQDVLDNNQPLRIRPELASAPALRGFTFLSAKPQLVIINNDDEDETVPEWKTKPEGLDMLLVRGRLEMEIAAMSPEEAEEFLVAYHIEKFALDRVILSSYSLMNLISFFTVVHDEVRAWTITSGASALKAAGTVHSDMEKGFIRAEVLSFERLKAHGSFQEAKKAGDVHLEGKEYSVQDGDVINFRFNI